MADFWTNKDGLVIHYGPRATDDEVVTRAPRPEGIMQQVTVDFDYNDIAATAAAGGFFNQDADGDGTNDSPSGINVPIPDGASIVSAKVIVTTAWTSGGAATLDIGTYKSDGTAIDANGLVAGEAVANLTANAVITGAGAQVGTRVAPGAAIYLGANYGTAAFTAGAAKLVVEYIAP